MNTIIGPKTEYLAVNTGKVDEDRVVVLTVRFDGTFQPHNLLISRKQAERLAEDLKEVLKNSSMPLLTTPLQKYIK